MDFFKSESASITMSHVVDTNDHMRDASHRAIYNNFFLGRSIITPTVIDTTSFGCYNLNPAGLIAALRWGPVITEQPTKIFPDAVFQFYANLKQEGPLSSGKFNTYVDGHIIFVTHLLLAQVFHFFLTRVLLPRSLSQFLVTPMDTWIMHSATVGRHLNFCSLMFATMRYSETHKVDYLRTQHVFRRIGWSQCIPKPGNDSRGGFNISGMDADVVDDLATQAELKLRVWCDYLDASDYERSPDHPF
ncbi:hypothetical protein LINPERPRIM_LOCUS35753 [Linum perenne]